MAKLLFTHSYFYRFDPKQWKAAQPFPPLMTITAAALMRAEGNEVALFDVAFRHGPREILPVLETEQPDYLVIFDDGFNYLTKMCLTNMREAAFVMAGLAKERGAKVIVCSSDSTDHYDKYLQQGADVVLLGEGEISLKELVAKLESGDPDISKIPGLAYLEDGRPRLTPKRPAMRDLDALPMAAWDLVDIDTYRQIWLSHHGYFSLNLATTRGCPFKCNWCAKPIYGNRYNVRSPEKVVSEIEYLLDHFKPDHFWMCDDIFGLKPGWVQKFREIVLERQLNFTYKIQSRVDLLLQEDTIEALAQSGLETVWVGAESGSQKILDAMDKGTKIEQIYEATRLIKKNGVKVGFFLQFGYLGEEKEDIEKTIQMVLDLMPDDIGVSVSYPLPGTKFYDLVKEELKDKANWTDSDELALMFRNTFQPSFYKRLHRYIHKVYRKKQASENIRGLLRHPFQRNRKQIRSALSMLYYLPATYLDAVLLRIREKETVSH